MLFLSLVLPVSFDFLELVYLFACYYGIHTAVFFVTLGIYTNALRGQKMKYGRAGISILFALLLGFQGARGILIIYAPLLGIELLRSLCLICKKQKRNREDLLISAWTGLLLAVSFWGNSFSFSVGQEFSRNIRKGFYKLIKIVIPDILHIMGLNEGMTVGRICLGLLAACAAIWLFHVLWNIFKEMTGVEGGGKTREMGISGDNQFPPYNGVNRSVHYDRQCREILFYAYLCNGIWSSIAGTEKKMAMVHGDTGGGAGAAPRLSGILSCFLCKGAA